MNILLTSLMVPGAPSGVRVHYERLAGQLRREGHTVTVITQDDLRPFIRRAIGGVRRGLTLLLGKMGLRIAIEVGSVAEIYFAIDKKAHYDVVNAQDVSSGWAARLALKDRVPVVVTGHFNDHPAEELIHQLGFKGLTARFLHRWYKFLLERTAYFIGVSDYVRQRSLPWLPATALHTVVYNGVTMEPTGDVPSVPAGLPDLRAQFAGRRILVNIGHLEARKNQRYLIPVAAALRQHYPGFVLALVGKGEDEPLLRQLIAENDLQNHVVLPGYHSSVMPFLRAADLYMHAATRENCPLVLLEAMAVACPAVALAAGGIPELLAATPEALLPVTTAPAAAAQRLQQLLETPGALAELRARQRAFGEIHFTSAVMIADTLAFFDQARQRHGLPALLADTSDPARPARQPVVSVPVESEV